MSPTLTYSETLVTCSCWCGISLAIPRNLHASAKRTKDQAIFCPLGHEFVFGDTIEEQLAREKQRAKDAERRAAATRDLLHAEERSHAATRGHLTRHRKRAAAGVCPCCNRQFQNVARHMATKHPDFREAE